MSSNIRIAHLIVRLDTGGAEKSLYRLVRGTSDQLSHHIICFGPHSDIGRDIEALGVTVTWLDYRKLGPLVLWRAWRVLREQTPQVVQGWMYFGNLIASIVSLGLPRRVKLAWNVRQSPDNFSLEKRRTRLAIALARLPGLSPDMVIYNSFAGQRAHQRFGFNRRAHTVIVNGIDTEEFRPAAECRTHWRTTHGVGIESWVGLVCRYHPLKGVAEFLQAVRLIVDETDEVIRFVLAGPGMTMDNLALVKLMDRYRVSADEIDLLGPIEDTAKFLPALDLLVIASVREGTPNVLLEAMACGVKTVATRVGDVALILGDPARVVEPGNVAELAQKIKLALQCKEDLERRRVGQEIELIRAEYHTGQCMQAYLNTYNKLLDVDASSEC
jgi:glycosyltransferase involved in cell wall biosynthesis